MTAEEKQDGARSGLQQLIQTAGASVALVVALTTAGYTLYQKLIVDPINERTEKKKDFSDSLGKFASTLQLMQTQLSFATNDQNKSSIIIDFSYSLNAALTQSESDASTKGFMATPAEFNQLAVDEQSMNRWDQVITFARKSIAIGANNFDAANAHDMIGKALLAAKGPKAIVQGREEMKESQESIEGVTSLGMNQSRAGFLLDWAYLEGMWGDCNAYRDIIKRVDDLSLQSDVSPDFERVALSNPLMIRAAKRCAPDIDPVVALSDAGSPGQEAFLPKLVDSNDADHSATPIDPNAEVVSVEDALGANQNYEAITIYINGQRAGHMHLGDSTQLASVSFSTKLGDAYRLEGYESTTENGQRVRRDIKGAGHFHGKIVSVYHLSKGSKTEDTQTVILDRGRAGAH